jgi:hypothetical protein
MVDEPQTIEEKINELMIEIESGYTIPVDQAKLSNIRASIVDLLERAMIYLNKTYSTLTSWQKVHIVETINALYWDWLYLAINSIRLAIADPSTISSDNKYKDEIVKLTFDDLIEQILLVKSRLK